MSETERRRHYVIKRILIEASRILTPSFRAQGIYLSGAQVELLRNITGYLSRQETFVDTYSVGYYTMVDTDDWDTIEAIVADLEDKLMTAQNVMFGYSESWEGSLVSLAGTDGAQTVSLDPVGAGEVLRLEAVSWYNNTGARGAMQIQVKTGTFITRLDYIQSPAVQEPVLWSGVITLQEGDKLVVKQYNALEDDYFVGAARGYKMVIPE